MAASGRAQRPFSSELGLMRVAVDWVDTDRGLAFVHDQWGTPRTISVRRMRASGMTPEPGESWFVDLTYGVYTFAAIASPKRGPEIHTTHDFNAAFMFG